jgi:hypothetical protein
VLPNGVGKPVFRYHRADGGASGGAIGSPVSYEGYIKVVDRFVEAPPRYAVIRRGALHTMKAEKRFVAVVLLATSAVAHANPVESWECKDLLERSSSVLVTATVESGRDKGTISVSGIKHTTAFRVAGFNRRWDFGRSPGGGYQYAFIIEPNGDGQYYEFNSDSTAKPRNFMRCRQSSAADAAG